MLQNRCVEMRSCVRVTRDGNFITINRAALLNIKRFYYCCGNTVVQNNCNPLGLSWSFPYYAIRSVCQLGAVLLPFFESSGAADRQNRDKENKARVFSYKISFLRHKIMSKNNPIVDFA